MTLTEKLARLEAKHGPVIAQVASKSEPDTKRDVRYRDGQYWCACIGWHIRKTCRHVDYCRARGYISQLHSPTKAASFIESDEAERIVGDVLRAGGIFATGTQQQRMVTKLRLILAMPVTTHVTPDALTFGSGVRQIVLED